MNIPLLNRVVNADCREFVSHIPDNSIDLIFTDPPYDKAGIPMYSWLAQEAARVLKPGSFCMCYTGGLYFDSIMADMLTHLEYFYLCMTYEPGKTPRVWPRRIVQVSKPMVIFCKPPMRMPYQLVRNVFQTRNDKHFHKWGQDVTCARYYIYCLSRPGDLLLEPFAGGGTTCVAALQEGRNFYACELNEKNAAICNQRLDLLQPKLFHEEVQISF